MQIKHELLDDMAIEKICNTPIPRLDKQCIHKVYHLLKPLAVIIEQSCSKSKNANMEYRVLNMSITCKNLSLNQHISFQIKDLNSTHLPQMKELCKCRA